MDVGCGRKTTLVEVPKNAHLSGIDIEAAVLDLNQVVDEKILGYVQSLELPHAAFDLITCHDVLEHLENPAAALRNIGQALAPGGTVELGLPYVQSAKSIITKLTPHRFHIWFYRRVFRFELAGRPGYGPYPTYLKWSSLTPARLRDWAEGCGLEVTSCRIEQSNSQVVGLMRRWRILSPALRVIWPFGDPAFTELNFSARRPDLTDMP